MKVLIVEDDASVRDMLAHRLKHEGCEVCEASSCAHAVEAFKNHRFDKVVTDLAMPERDGFEVAKEIRQIDPEIQIAAYTAYPVAINSAARGIDAYFVKSVDDDALMKWVTE